MDGTTFSIPSTLNETLGEEKELVMTDKGNGIGNFSSNNGGGASSSPSTNANASTSTQSLAEQQMIDEINVMRRGPKGYVRHAEEYIGQVKNDAMLDAAYKTEEISSAIELISELKNLKPLPILEPHQGLHRVGITHGKDVQQQGMIGHKGSDGSLPWARVRRDIELSDGNENLVAGGNTVKESLMILLVDSGIPGRGPRKTLLEPKWTQCGIYLIGDVGGIPNTWIQVFGIK